MTEADRQLPEEVRREIALSRRLTDALSIPVEHAERIALLAYLRGKGDGARAGGNYIADKEVDPTQVTFANGRIVRAIGGHLVIERNE